MSNHRWVRLVVGVLLIAANVSCDQITKAIVRKDINPYEQITVIDNHITLTKVENTGAFLSLGQSWWPPLKTALLIVLPIFALAFACYAMVERSRGPWFAVGLGFAIGGGIGNMIDRIIRGSVTDFLHLKAGMFQTGIFNMADVSIMVGIGIVLVDTLAVRRQRLFY
ncbi:signal peptidase II [Parapedobacter deserti]|uniref:Lipoprotein signal peptidase n=1 Tax=Parapedobacter deserti TaxID=1912957 RepID=A0ABV7JGQ7_9SPHI